MRCNKQNDTSAIELVQMHECLGLEQSSLVNESLVEVWNFALEKIYKETAAVGVFFQIKKSEESAEKLGTQNCDGLFLLDFKEQQSERYLDHIIHSLTQNGGQIGLRYPSNFRKKAGLTVGIEQSVLENVFTLNGMQLSEPICWQPFPYKDTFQFMILESGHENQDQISRKDLMFFRLMLIDFSNEFLRLIHLGRFPEKKLTAKQMEILHLIGSEATDQEIAAQLGISCSAVRRRLEAIQMKFSTTKRVGLIVKAVQNGTILDTILNEIY